jgi:predicted nuclease of predicted toxin-antitoxin system
MNLLADENFPRPAVLALREAGFDVLWIGESQPGASDEVVLEMCATAGRVLLTFDKDFGELAFRRGVPAQCEIILFRVIRQSPQEVGQLALRVLRSQTTWAGYFSVVSSRSVRIRPLRKL